jgi:hypothetical protein
MVFDEHCGTRVDVGRIPDCKTCKSSTSELANKAHSMEIGVAGFSSSQTGIPGSRGDVKLNPPTTVPMLPLLFCVRN